MEQKPGGRPSPQIYVPRGRRELNEKREQEEKLKREDEAKRPASNMENSSEPNSPTRKALRTNNRWVLDDNADTSPKESASSSSRYYQPYQPPKIDDSEFSTVIDDEKLASSCIVITGIPVDMSDAGRSRVVEQYQQAGGILRWFGNIAIVAFANENIASRALKSNNKSIYKAESLLDSSYSTEYIAVAREIHGQLKPEITTRVANRLIGAALNIRIAKPAIPAQSTASIKHVVRKEETVEDAWDS